MQIKINLDRLFDGLAPEAKRGMLSRLRAGVSPYGPPLDPTKQDDGPLGGAGVPAGIAAGRVTTHPDGFSILFNDTVSLFHSGRQNGPSKQAPRPVAAFTKAERARWTQLTADETAKQITAQLDRGAP